MISTFTGAVALLIAGAAQARAQACPPITTTIAGDAFGNNEASAGTSLVIPSYAPANTLYSCAQGFANAGATVLVAEPATLTMSASAWPIVAATAVSDVVVPTATWAAVTGTGTGTISISIGPDSLLVRLEGVGPGRRMIIETGANELEAGCRGADCQITALGVSNGYVAATSSGALAVATFVGGGSHSIDARGGATISATGPAISAVVEGQGTLEGPDANCYAQGFGSSCTVGGDRAQVSAGAANAYVAITSGTGGAAEAFNFGTVSVIGGNTATARSGGVASIDSGAQVFVSSGAGDVFVSSGATGTLEIGATVFSAPAATITAAPDTTFASIGTRDDYVILEARSAVLPSLVRKRLAAPVPTSVCEPFLAECPNLRGELNCVNVKADIFNCGGCALEGKGVDCTSQDASGRVSCVDGTCVSN